MRSCPPPQFQNGIKRKLPTHCKTFLGEPQLQMVVRTHRRLEQSGFYWGPISGKEANRLLAKQPTGTFLLRDSSDAHHFFTLSVKTESGTKNLRIKSDARTFRLESEPSGPHPVPQFDCVLKLVHHYMPQTHPNSGRPSSYIYSDGEKIPLSLLHPLRTELTSLKHLCRRTVNGHQGACAERNQLPLTLQEFLQEYDLPI
uniref:Suppressor of cytokine signaling 3 n=1 Tax=Denticeps clupeoides TaxID=299321 RepID=A0AAY4AQ74_9TELE